ncbi:MAG: sseA [Tardiphaga sp.]|nr:sseA [Tardiphaga sp.]
MLTSNDPMVSTEWLAANLDNPDVRVLDASFRMPAMRPPTAREEYDARHLPGAAFFDIDAIADRTSSLPHMLPPPLLFAREIGQLGIENTHTVIVYDRGDYMGAPRAWWTFRVFGHADVRVLDGGLKRWLAEGRAVNAEKVWHAPGTFHAHYDSGRVRDRDDMEKNVVSGREQMVDARAKERFEGSVAEPWPGRRAGRIPNSLNVPFNTLYEADTGLLKSADQLRDIFNAAGVDLTRPIVTTCGSGVTAAVITLALARIGLNDTALYDGSWAEWGLPDGPVVATGAA